MVEGINNSNIVIAQKTKPEQAASIHNTKINEHSQPSKDTFEGSTGLTKRQKTMLGIGIGVAALGIGFAIKILTRGKIHPVKMKQLARHIEFKKCETFEEAIEFGKKHLGIKQYDGFTKKDLEIINWINEGLVNVSNYKKGKLKFPDIISYAENKSEKTVAYVLRNDKIFENILYINKNYVNNIDKRIAEHNNIGQMMINKFEPETLKDIVTALDKFKNGKLIKFNDKIKLLDDLCKLDTEYLEPANKKLKKLVTNPKSRERLEKLGFLKGDELEFFQNFPKLDINHLEQYDPRMLNVAFDAISEKAGFKLVHESASPFRTVYHEIGHLQYKPIGLCGTGDVPFNESLEKYWNGDVKAFGTAFSVSNYASTSPSEFVAEAFAEMVSGHKLSDEAIELFEKITNQYK